jgi:hypothetical protein
VSFLGCVGTAQKVPLLRDARALLAPIDWHEPFGLILIEAMLSGCPVVSFGKGSVPELVEPGLTGFIVDSMEEMADVIRPGGAVDQRERMLLDYEALYQSVLAEAGRADRRPITAA